MPARSKKSSTTTSAKRDASASVSKEGAVVLGKGEKAISARREKNKPLAQNVIFVGRKFTALQDVFRSLLHEVMTAKKSVAQLKLNMTSTHA